ncbi:MAG: DUF1080 domain-containing protein [Planctomycetes bacterium]|nr:DUF1080 domain-containing protein [Planctomycetota bacterium]
MRRIGGQQSGRRGGWRSGRRGTWWGARIAAGIFSASTVALPFFAAAQDAAAPGGAPAAPQPASADAPAPEPRGLITRTERACPGYTLFAPFSETTTYLIDLDGRVVHTWQSRYTPGLLAYLLPDGRLLRGISVDAKVPFKDNGGDSGGVQLFSWDGELLWEYHIATEFGLQHHDLEPLPNGNLLVIVREVKSREQVRDAGRLPDAIGDDGMWPCAVLEIEPLPPTGARVVWEWHAWDHLIQDIDPDRPNHGVVAENPQRININGDLPRGEEPADAELSPEERAQMQAVGYLAAADTVDDAEKKRRTNADWLHLNAVDYHPKLDQIALSSPRLNEVWIIDHGTTTAEARGSTGGKRGKGGDLLWRWGNPQVAQLGRKKERQLFFQHDVQWIPAGFPGAGHLTIFNNGRQREGGDRSAVLEVAPPLLPDGTYAREPGQPFGPAAPCWSYDPPQSAGFYASFISGAHRLQNGNTLVCDGPTGRLFEVTPDGAVAWDYKVPYGRTDSEDGPRMSHSLFRATRIAPDHPAIVARLPKGQATLAALDPQPQTLAQIEAEKAAKAPPTPVGWQPLFKLDDGLSGWVPVNVARGTFSVVPDPEDAQQPLVKCTGKPTGILRSARMWENFVCEFEWRHLEEPGNAGFFVWADPLPAQGGPFTRGIEVQVCNLGNGDWFTSHGDLFPIWGATMTPDPRFRISGDRSMPKEDAFHARKTGEWNHYRISCVDGAIALEVNGQLVTAGSGCSPSKGYLCIESEGGPVEFRRMRIWELPAGTHAADAARTARTAGGHRPLYDGVSLDGWEKAAGEWSVEDWRLVAKAGAPARLAERGVKGAREYRLDWKRAAVPTGGLLPFTLGDAAYALVGGSATGAAGAATAAERPGAWNRLIVRRDGAQLLFELNGVACSATLVGGTAPAHAAGLPPLTLCSDGTATEFCSVIAEGE